MATLKKKNRQATARPLTHASLHELFSPRAKKILGAEIGTVGSWLSWVPSLPLTLLVLRNLAKFSCGKVPCMPRTCFVVMPFAALVSVRTARLKPFRSPRTSSIHNVRAKAFCIAGHAAGAFLTRAHTLVRICQHHAFEWWYGATCPASLASGRDLLRAIRCAIIACSGPTSSGVLGRKKEAGRPLPTCNSLPGRVQSLPAERVRFPQFKQNLLIALPLELSPCFEISHNSALTGCSGYSDSKSLNRCQPTCLIFSSCSMAGSDFPK